MIAMINQLMLIYYLIRTIEILEDENDDMKRYIKQLEKIVNDLDKKNKLAKKTTNEDDIFTKVSDNTIINKKLKCNTNLLK